MLITIKNKKADAKAEPFIEIIKWVLLAALLIWALYFWFPYLKDKAIEILNQIF